MKFQKHITIVPKRKAKRVLSKLMDKDILCYYLSDNYDEYVELQNYFEGKIQIKNLSGMFDETFQEIKEKLLQSLADLNKRYNSYAWWGGQVAAKSTLATSLQLNITYYMCAQKLLLKKSGNTVFIVESSALAKCLSGFSRKQGFRCRDYRNKLFEYWSGLKRCLYYIAQIGCFFLRTIKNYRVISKNLKLMMEKKTQSKKRVIIRSWVTNNIFDRSEKFRDRNFGYLPDWLH